MSLAEKWMLGCTLVMVACTVGALAISIMAFNKKTNVRVQQPLDTRLVLSTNELTRDIKAINHRVVALESWRSQLMSKLDADKLEMLEAGEDRARRISANVDDVRRELDAKIREIPTSVIAILKDTGAI